VSDVETQFQAVLVDGLKTTASSTSYLSIPDSHGIASLFVRADPSRRKLPMSPEDLLEAAVLVYLQGLGLGGGR